MPTEPLVTRLNVLALPTRTTLLFFLIVLVVASAVVASLGGGSTICTPFLVVGMFILPIRALLRRPAQELEKCKKVDISERYPLLVERWNHLAVNGAHTKPPRLALTIRDPVEPYSFGTFTWRYVALSDSVAQEIQIKLQSADESVRKSGEAVLLHELAHFVHHDVWMAFFSSNFLVVAIVFMTLDFLANALLSFLYNSAISFFDFSRLLPSELIKMISTLDPPIARFPIHLVPIAPAVWVRYELVNFTEHLPIVLGGLILVVFYWRALVRTRELYADARVAQWQGDAQPLRAGLGFIHTIQNLRAASEGDWRRKLRGWRARFRVPVLNGVTGWLGTHPTLAVRQKILREPYKIYGNDAAIVLSAGGAAVLINLIFSALFSSRYIRGPNSAVPFIIGFLVLSLSLLPYLCQFSQNRIEYFEKVFRTVLGFTAVKLMPQYFLSFVVTFGVLQDPGIVDGAAYALVPGVGENPPPLNVPVDFVLDMFVIRPGLLFTFGMPVVLMCFLFFDAAIKRRVLRWYSARSVTRDPASAFLIVSAFLAVFMGLFLLPILDALTNPAAHDLHDPLALSGMVLAVVGLIGGSILFLIWDRRYLDRCPRCDAPAKGDYWLGKTCSVCRELFHPWLCASVSWPSQKPSKASSCACSVTPDSTE